MCCCAVEVEQRSLCLCAHRAVARTLYSVVRIGDAVVSVVCDGTQLAILLMFCHTVKQPILQLAVSVAGPTAQ